MKIIKKIILKFRLQNILALPMYIFRLFPINNKKIVISNYFGKGYGDNGKYIAEYLRKNKEYDLVWVVKKKDDNNNIPEDIRQVKINSLRYFYELSTAKIWINNCRFDSFIRKRKNQFYIQTWHGTLGLKKIEYDIFDKLTEYCRQMIDNDNKMIDLMISNSDYFTNLCRTAFRYNGEILEYGYPRSDILISKNDKIINKVKDYYNIKTTDKIVLYAPTFREKYLTNPYNINFDKLQEELEKKYNINYKILIKLHPNVKNIKDFIKTNNVINATSYPDIQELIYACDLLITDYSSTMFEALFADKPVILYASDIKNYNDERGMYLKFTDLPFPLTKNNKELLNYIQNSDLNEIRKKYKDSYKKFGIKETGKSCEMIAKEIKKITS